MKIYVKLFATLIQNVPDSVQALVPQGIHAAVPFQVELPEDSVLADLISLLQLPVDQVKVVFVNGRARPLDHGLAAGDEVGIFPPIGGG